ncbi:DUF4173 domain-containing protein [Hymenobacter busanensis]|uniref:DUF4173 domain-containing protein n=1 Tax=Hymenobacter busanensis TaxID=2607656 RepID=A0A7L5A2E4_9BACT|nr:DUF4173 domain-containing protein [Hymenobacter busanensis]KAA9338378.1 DUF4173 domain-containing protein [Hymenobacter busanensis]QHJ09195.1 DUF4173 domain-containing protein [Hymenobacter busanensis]
MLPLFAARTTEWTAAHGLLSWRPARLVLTATQKWLLPLGTLLFHVLFWQENVGLNLALYTLLALGILLLSRPKAAWRSSYFRLLVAGTVAAAVAVLLYGSFAAFFACFVSMAMVLGFANQPHLKQLFLAGMTGGFSAAEVLLGLPGVLIRTYIPTRETKAGRTFWYAKLLLVPVLVLVVFHVLFLLANPRYNALANQLWAPIADGLLRLLEMLLHAPVVFWIFAVSFTAVVLLRVPVPVLAQLEARFPEFVHRRRDGVASFSVRNPDFREWRFRMADLRKEYLAALAVFGLVNLLLLAVNAIDISWLWFGFVPEPGFDLAQFVHEGTYVLIFSILLAMGIVLWFFRRNLNFYQPGLPLLRWGATLWVLQNAVLAVSVGLRNYYYIVHMGLAYKRVGVCFFLLLTLFGLATILLKIWQRRSAFSLVRLNSLAAYVVLLCLALGNWEIWIAGYNLTSHRANPRRDPHHFDLGFLLNMPGRVLPTLVAQRATLNEYPYLTVAGPHHQATQLQPAAAQRALDERVAEWRAAYEAEASWQDWTYADWAAYQALKSYQPATNR